MVLSRLSLIDEPGWDLPHIRKTANLLDYFDHLISNFEEVGAAIDQNQREPCRMSLASGCAMAMKKVRGAYVVKEASASGPQPSQEQPGAGGIDTGINFEQFDWIDDGYWQELTGDMGVIQ